MLFKAKPKQPFGPKRLALEAAKLSLLLAIISPCNQWLCNLMLFHPDTNAQLDQRAIAAINQRFKSTWTEEYFPSRQNNVVLNGWYIKLPNARKTILVSHGNAGNMAYRAILIATLLHCGASVFIYDYQGYGKSKGSPSTEGIVADGLGAYDYLVQKKHISPSDIVVYGESLGCAVSTQIARQKVSGIILQSGFSSLVTAAKDKLPWMRLYPDALFPQRFLDNLEAYKISHAPLLLLHGQQDNILPADYSRTIYATACEPKRLVILPNCAHNDVHMKDVAESTGAIKDFLGSLILPAVAEK